MDIKKHQHCPVCGNILNEVFRLPWKVKDGVEIWYADDQHVFKKSEYDSEIEWMNEPIDDRWFWLVPIIAFVSFILGVIVAL